MSILRYDVTTNDWVIFAPERVRRPHNGREPDTIRAEGARSEGPCPFCPGNERLTAPEIYALRTNASPGWQVRVVPNKFPALRIEEDTRRIEQGPIFHCMGGCGAHEVVIESPAHDLVLCQQPIDQIEGLLRTLQARFNDLLRDARFQTIVIFKNHGKGAGTSLHHPHWQIIAAPVVPRMLRLKHAVATDYFDQTGQCLYCVMLEEELRARQRVVAENDRYAAITPYASAVPFAVWLLPKAHRSSFGSVDSAGLRSLGELLKNVLGMLYRGLDNPDFNLVVNTAPRGDEDKGYFLWHMEILPRLTTPAGFEMGSGMAINTVMPEEAAEFLRGVNPA